MSVLTERGWPHFATGFDIAAVAARHSGLKLTAPALGCWVTHVGCVRNYDQLTPGTLVEVRQGMLLVVLAADDDFADGAAIALDNYGEPTGQAALATVTEGDMLTQVAIARPRFELSAWEPPRPLFIPSGSFLFVLNPNVNESARLSVGWVEVLV